MGAGLIYLMAATLCMGPGDDDDAPVKVRMHGKYSDRCFVVSKCDVERVMKHKWRMWGRYPFSKTAGQLHHFIIGARPSNVPGDWVVDHANGDDLDATRPNLRWVTQQFNAWNRKQKEGTSKYRGLRLEKGRWRATCLAVNLGTFDREVDAGIACAKYAIKEFGDWAITGHVLRANFTLQELESMRNCVLEGKYEVWTNTKTLPAGVTYNIRIKKFYVRCAGVYIGCYDTAEEAIRANTEYREAKLDSEWEAHKKTDITRNPHDNAAMIALSGDKALGQFTKVPDEFWHQLTFKTSWNLSRRYAVGHWNCKMLSLHAAVWSLLNPGYKPVKGISIDHRNPELTLDNRAHNLRLATRSDQERNKQNRGSTSKYPGVWRRENGTYCGRVIVEGKAHNVSGKTEVEAAKALNAMRIRLLGADTPLMTIVE